MKKIAFVYFEIEEQNVNVDEKINTKTKGTLDKCRRRGTMLGTGKNVKSFPKRTDQTETWLSTFNNICVVRIVSRRKIIIDLYKITNCNHVWKVEERTQQGQGKYRGTFAPM